MRTFAERLKEALAETGLRAADLALLAGISKAAVSGYLSGSVHPPDKKKAQIALALGKAEDFFKKEAIQEEISLDGGYRLPVTEAAKLMGIGPAALMTGLQEGVFPFGYAIKGKGKKKYTYWISRVRFTAETGIPVGEPDR